MPVRSPDGGVSEYRGEREREREREGGRDGASERDRE